MEPISSVERVCSNKFATREAADDTVRNMLSVKSVNEIIVLEK